MQPLADDTPAPAAAGERSQGPVRNIKTRWWYFKWGVRGLALLLLLWFVSCVGLDSKFYYPDRRTYEKPETFRLRYEDVHFKTRDGLRLHGWFLPAEGEPRGLVVHFHGNAANVSAHLALVEWLPRRGYHLLMFDYRGYGQSEGRVTRAGTIADGHAAIDYALSRPELTQRLEATDGSSGAPAARLPLFVYGQSLGAAVGVVVAAERPEVDSVVAESPFSDYRRIAGMHARSMFGSEWLGSGVANLLISDGHDPIDRVGEISPRPLLVILAEKDSICFPILGQELFDAAREPKELWCAPGAEHLGILSDHDLELMDRITGFFERGAAKKEPR